MRKYVLHRVRPFRVFAGGMETTRLVKGHGDIDRVYTSVGEPKYVVCVSNVKPHFSATRIDIAQWPA